MLTPYADLGIRASRPPHRGVLELHDVRECGLVESSPVKCDYSLDKFVKRGHAARITNMPQFF
ncbi:hypothetical protein FIBSPDRAFT_865191 [Athelia psychrophila]|uniref:Uncharacterized protein n=1 Tax=Athelia psychrophila TaxID=1759441 RepID=A0A166FV52_9AGAM|nr:hypothetical protein FIBSPDRAFT_865191 [Fibularhizoctonia sp. CBS 109695]